MGLGLGLGWLQGSAGLLQLSGFMTAPSCSLHAVFADPYGLHAPRSWAHQQDYINIELDSHRNALIRVRAEHGWMD